MDGRSNVYLGIAGCKPLVPGNRRQRSGQIVTDLFKTGGKVGVVQREADPIFHHPQPFSPAVGGRVENSQHGAWSESYW